MNRDFVIETAAGADPPGPSAPVPESGFAGRARGAGIG